MGKAEMMKRTYGGKHAEGHRHQHSQSLDMPSYKPPKYLHRQASLNSLSSEDDDGGTELQRGASVATAGSEGMFDRLALKLFGSMINRGKEPLKVNEDAQLSSSATTCKSLITWRRRNSP